MANPALSIVREDPVDTRLRANIIARDEAMRTVKRFDAIIADELRELAKQRGVAFIRVETARKELLS